MSNDLQEMKDFTLKSYKLLLYFLKEEGHLFQTMREYSPVESGKVVVLRHDVDRNKEKALYLARIEQVMGVTATYYFRAFPESYESNLVKEIAEMGHEIGYHYENMASQAKELRTKNKDLRKINGAFNELLMKKMNREVLFTTESTEKHRKKEKTKRKKINTKMNKVFSHDKILEGKELSIEFERIWEGMKKNLRDKAERLFEEGIKDFETNLKEMRKSAVIETISMHGRPRVPIDNRFLWLKYDYHDYGINIEPYFDVDYDEWLYITDAGRTWYDTKANQRDKVRSKYHYRFESTVDIIRQLREKQLPKKIIFNIHPEHWTDDRLEWWMILGMRKVKNFTKKRLLK